MRLALSTALCVDPDILLIDEVLSVGDYSFQQKSSDAFQRIKKSGKSIIFVSHNLRQLEEFCDRVILLEKGKIIETGKPGKIIETYIKFMSK
jgi:ABC-type polysaccharide/polyol phosphate transport system ATPase subunit